MDTVVDLASAILKAVQGGNYVLAAALALVVTVGLVRQFSPWSWVRTDLGASLLLFGASFGGALATTAASWTAPTWALVYAAFKVGYLAAGGFTVLKKLVLPLLGVLSNKVEWLKKPLELVTKIISTGIGTSPIRKAELAGQTAVKSKPGVGISGVIGEPKDVP